MMALQHKDGQPSPTVAVRNSESPTSTRTREQQLADSCQGLVRTIAWQIHRRMPAHVEIDDLISYGQLGLAQAAKKFDPGKGASFTTFAFCRIRGAILDGLSQMAWFSRHEYHSRRYEQMANEVMHLAVDDMSPSDGGESTQWVRGLAGSLAVVYLATTSSGSELSEPGDDAIGGMVDPADSREAGPQQDAIYTELRSRLHELIEGLPADAGMLIRLTYFQGMSLQEAADELRISRSWASRLHQKTLDRLARGMRAIGVDDAS